MIPKELDVVRLKDGRQAVILETYDKSKAFYVEIQIEDKDPDLDVISIYDIDTVTCVYKK